MWSLIVRKVISIRKKVSVKGDAVFGKEKLRVV
jgi:hypothetical protein